MAKVGGLGRGLDALMGAGKEEARPRAAVPEGIEVDSDGCLWIDPRRLSPNPRQPRVEFDEGALEELSASIKEHGVVQPIIIEREDGGGFHIIAGERRARASIMAGAAKVPVQIRRYDEQKKLEVALVENIQRADLNPIEEASAYMNLMEMGDLSQDELSRRVGKKRSTVANALRLLKLPSDIQDALKKGDITPGHARAILSVPSEEGRRKLFDKIVGSGLSVREAESLARRGDGKSQAKAQKKPRGEAFKDPDILSIEQQLLEKFGAKCKINGSLEKGKIEIEYYNRDGLDRLCETLLK